MAVYSLVSSSSVQTVPFTLVSGSLDQLKDLRGLDGCGTFLDTAGRGGAIEGRGLGADGRGGGPGAGGGIAGAGQGGGGGTLPPSSNIRPGS